MISLVRDGICENDRNVIVDQMKDVQIDGNDLIWSAIINTHLTDATILVKAENKDNQLLWGDNS